jgi:hypothetical protein
MLGKREPILLLVLLFLLEPQRGFVGAAAIFAAPSPSRTGVAGHSYIPAPLLSTHITEGDDFVAIPLLVSPVIVERDLYRVLMVMVHAILLSLVE